MKNQRIVIIGAGAVGATIAYTLLIRERFREIILIDIDREKAEGEALDISHGVPFVRPAVIRAGDYTDCRTADLILLAAGAAQAPGESRTDLLSKNASIFRNILENVTRYCKEDVILLTVTNPVDILTYVTLKITGLSPKRVLGSGTLLDTARLRSELSAHTHVDARNIHAFVIGEHGDSEVVAWHAANIAGLPIRDFCEKCGACGGKSMDEMGRNVKNAAYEIVEKKGATYYAVSLATERIVRALEGENAVLTVSGLMDGEYGLKNVCLSIPRTVGADGLGRSVALPLSVYEETALRAGAERLRGLAKTVLGM